MTHNDYDSTLIIILQCLLAGVRGLLGEAAPPLVEVADSKGQGDVWEATRVLDATLNLGTATQTAVLNVSPLFYQYLHPHNYVHVHCPCSCHVGLLGKLVGLQQYLSRRSPPKNQEMSEWQHLPW